MTDRMPCSISDGPQLPEDVDHGYRDEPEYNKYDDDNWLEGFDPKTIDDKLRSQSLPIC